MLVSHYKIKCSLFILQNCDYFLNIIPWHTDLFITSWQEFKNCHSRNKAFAFAAIHEVPFAPPNCYGIGDLSCIASGFHSYLSYIHMQILIIPVRCLYVWSLVTRKCTLVMTPSLLYI
jgi:hypothetical protein